MDQKSKVSFFSGRLVLNSARKLYLLLTAGAAVLAVLGVAVFVVLHGLSHYPAPVPEQPPTYTPQVPEVDGDAVAQALKPPTNVRFVVTLKLIDAALTGDEALGYFEADTPNGLARYPDDFDIFGGPDAALFERVSVRVENETGSYVRAGLKPSADLVAQINAALATAVKQQSRSYSIVIVAHDRFGNTSKPATIAFALSYQRAAEVKQQTAQLSDLQRVAHGIAQFLDPSQGTAFNDAYSRALRVPRDCGLTSDSIGFKNFVRGYGTSFQTLKAQLSAANIETFYAGVCQGWQKGVDKEMARLRSVNEAGERVLAKNAEKQEKFDKFMGWVLRWKAVAAGEIGLALKAFLAISLLLAFLTIEFHLAAIRRSLKRDSDPDTEV